MFMTFKRSERKAPEPAPAGGRLSDALLRSVSQGILFLDSGGRMLPQASQSLGTLFRREEFVDLTFEKLLAPLVTAKTLSAVRAQTTRLFRPEAQATAEDLKVLQDVELRLPNLPDGSSTRAHYAFEFCAMDDSFAPYAWLVTVTDITTRVQSTRELEDLRGQLQAHSEMLRCVMQHGGAHFAAFLQRTDASMKAINTVLKKPAREQSAFREKLEQTVQEVDRLRKDGAALKLTAMENAARLFEESLQELRNRKTLSGSDFLPLAVKLDQLYTQFAQVRSLTAQAGPAGRAEAPQSSARMTDNGTQIIDAPRFVTEMAARSAHRAAQAGSLDNTLKELTEHMAQEYSKSVILECEGLHLVPPQYQAAVKNIAIQFIRNAVMHGIETPEERQSASKAAHGTLRLEFKSLEDESFELLFQDDGRGIDPDQVRATAVTRGLLTEEAAAKMRDRQLIKLIFKSAYSTLSNAPGDPKHGAGMSLVRRYIHEAGGRVALASLLGHETRFKVALPAVGISESQVAGAA
jgi:two-component system, chemotaxis family, sensor kinase CheA